MSVSTHDGTTAGGTLAVVLGATMFSFGFVLVKSIGLPPPTLGLFRTLIGATALCSLALVLRVPRPKAMLPVLVAGLCFGGHQLFFIAATQQTSIAIVTLVAALTPLLVAMVSPWAIGERPASQLKYYALLAAAGVGTIVWANVDDPSRSVEGDLLAVANLFVYTGFFLATKRARASGTHTLTLTALLTLIAAVFISPALFFVTPRAPEHPWQWGLLVLLALGPGSGHLLVNWAHRRITAALSSLLLTAVPLLATLWAYVFLDEPLGPWQLLGVVLVTVAVELGRRAEVRRVLGQSS